MFPYYVEEKPYGFDSVSVKLPVMLNKFLALDFGGWSSFLYLRHLGVPYLKHARLVQPIFFPSETMQLLQPSYHDVHSYGIFTTGALGILQ